MGKKRNNRQRSKDTAITNGESVGDVDLVIDRNDVDENPVVETIQIPELEASIENSNSMDSLASYEDSPVVSSKENTTEDILEKSGDDNNDDETILEPTEKTSEDELESPKLEELKPELVLASEDEKSEHVEHPRNDENVRVLEETEILVGPQEIVKSEEMIDIKLNETAVISKQEPENIVEVNPDTIQNKRCSLSMTNWSNCSIL